MDVPLVDNVETDNQQHVVLQPAVQPAVHPPVPAAAALDGGAQNLQDGDNEDEEAEPRGGWLNEYSDDDENENENLITKKLCGGYVFICMRDDVALLVMSIIAFLCCLIDTIVTTTGFNITNGACPMSSHYSEIGYMEYGNVQLFCEGSTYANMVCQLLLVICFLVNWVVELRDKQCWLVMQMGLLFLGICTMALFFVLHLIGLIWWCQGVGKALKPEDHSSGAWHFLIQCSGNLHIFDGIAENYHLAPFFTVAVVETVLSAISCVLWTTLLIISVSKFREIRKRAELQKNEDDDDDDDDDAD